MQALSRKEYLEELWFTMHHSEKPDTRSLFVRCYLDESGTHDSTPQAVVAGLLTDRDGFLSLDDEWVDLLARYGVEPPLHMTEFGQHGRHGNINAGQRSQLFSEAVEIINRHKKYSIAATLSREAYETNMPLRVRKKWSLYGACFILCAYHNHLILEKVKYKDAIPYILHHGNPNKGHILAAQEACVGQRATHMGSITFDDGSKLCALQAADMIAWAVRRKLSKLPFDHGFEPVKGLFTRKHEQPSWTDKMLRELSERFPVGFDEDHNETE